MNIPIAITNKPEAKYNACFAQAALLNSKLSHFRKPTDDSESNPAL
jgi:hypothetical protein